MNKLTNYSLLNTSSLNAEIGIRGSTLYDPTNTPIFNNTLSEKVIQGQDNTWIVFGRDRPSDWDSGYGGKGHLKAGSIDIVVGRLSAMDASENPGPVNSNTGMDAARVYLSQKADIDEYYNLSAGTTGLSKALSAVAVKADAVRIIARDSLKLVTNTDSKLSNGEEAYSGAGVQMIANNDSSDMQPIPRGNNLVEAFEELSSHIKELNGVVMTFLKTQQKFNDAISDHTHFSPFYGLETSLDPFLYVDHKAVLLQQYLQTEQGLKFNTNNIEAWKTKYIRSTGSKYINSYFHSLN
jgi:hypothetical protein